MRYAIAALALLFSAPPLAFGAPPESFQTNRSLAESYIQRDDIRAALPYLEKAHQLDPRNYDNAYDLALAYLQTGSAAKSRKVVTNLLKGTDKAELHNLLGDIDAAENRIDEAARQYEMAARLDPTEKNLFDLGSYLAQHRGFEQALKVFEFAVQRYPDSARLQVGLGVARYSSGRYDEAVESLCHAVDLDPKDIRALDFLGKLYDVSPRYADEVTARLARFASLYPDSATVNYYYALSLRKRALSPNSGDADHKAEELLLRAAKLNPKLAEAHLELGLLYEDQAEDAKAIHEYQTATAIRSDLTKAHYRLGRLYQKTGQPVLAQKELHAVEALRAKTP